MTTPTSVPLQIAAGYERISDKARALADAGYSVSQIAKTLNRSYQQIRQIVKDYEARKARQGTANGADAPAPEHVGPAPQHEPSAPMRQEQPTRPAATGSATFFRLSVDDDGGIRLPRHILEAFSPSPGDVLTGVSGGGEIVIRSAEASIARAQELVRALIPGDDSLADSLIADRRREVEEERRDG